MSTNKRMSSARYRSDSIESIASMWEKIHEQSPHTKQDAPFANEENNDSSEENPNIDNDEDDDTDSDVQPSISTNSTTPKINEQSKPWENPTTQDRLILIINNSQNFDQRMQRLKNDFSIRGLKWTDEEEKQSSWHFGLASIHLHFTQPQLINIPILCLSSSIPFWITFPKNKQPNILKNNTLKPSIRHKFTSDLDVSLHYGALTNLNQFYYSPQHSWSNQEDSTNKNNLQWFLWLDDQRNNGGHIEWVIEDSTERRKRQLLVTNINHSIIVDSYEEGFDIYICQHCNMNEYEARSNSSQQNDNSINTHRSDQNNSNRSRNAYKHREQRSSNHRSNSRPRAPPPLLPMHNKPQRSRPTYYEPYHRTGVSGGCYFPTIQFSLRVNSPRLPYNNAENIQMRIKQTLSLLINFFLAHKITVCYGKINSHIGPDPHLFFRPKIPNFPSLIMKYSWQMLSIVGYRLQLQINEQRFLDELNKLSDTKENPDELFYRVCVYLSRVFSQKPFVNIIDELQHAISESKQKRDASAYGLVRKIDIDEENDAYIPSVTLTPTTIRIKPLKLCRTNRVLRARDQFGSPIYHFVLVDIRDENGRDLQSFHFRHLRQLLLDYLVEGFTLMNDDRKYQYLHHSQSQLRGRQFWFYHHDPDHPNLSFPEAYRWMGDFDQEQNPAKYAARMALCFSTTKATVEVPVDNVLQVKDIKRDGKELSFTDGCGRMSERFRNMIQKHLGTQNNFSAVQFRYAGAKGVVSLDTRIKDDYHLQIRPSMEKFISDHECFEVCKLSAPRPLYLNRQAILLLSYRKISDASFLVLQQQNHLQLIRALLRNSDAEKMILEKIPSWFLPKDIHIANIDFIREPFFRQLLISSCLQSTRDLLRRTRIRIPRNRGRNMMGIVDEYNVLKPDQVFIQYTILDKDPNDDKHTPKTQILDNCEVVITKNPCHHPGDIRTFTAVNHPTLKHLKDVIVFSQQGDRPAPHDISGSDLDGDEYLVVWHRDLVPYETDNAQPYDYDSQTPQLTYNRPVTRDDINKIILEIAEQDCLGKLSNLHLAFADKFGVDNNKRPKDDVLSTIELAGAISQEVDSGKTGYHPLNEDDIKRLNDALGKKRPDYMDNSNFEQEKSEHILGKLYRASKKTLPRWNRLVRYHRHLRHLQVRTRDVPEEDEEEEEGTNNGEKTNINLDSSLIIGVDRNHSQYPACEDFAVKLASVYRQEIFEILNLYGLSHESDLWCRNSMNGVSGELEDTAYTELEQLAERTRTRFFNEQVTYCQGSSCNDNTPVSELCSICRKRQQSMAVACYCACYGGNHASEEVPILSLPWLFASPLLHHRINQRLSPSEGLLSRSMKKAFEKLFDKRRLRLDGLTLKFTTSQKAFVGESNVDVTVCLFIEVLQGYLERKNYRYWRWILNRFVRKTASFALLSNEVEPTDEWKLELKTHEINKYDEYAGLLMSIIWTEREDKLMHDYFEEILNICFDEGRRSNNIDFLDISEEIILFLQQMAIEETVITKGDHT